LIRGAADEEDVKAIVLRVNSGGGSLFASEVIRQQVLYAKEQGLPVVISMGAVAASGGYYIAAQADEIWATPGSITGSIGVFAAFPTFEQLLARLGVHTDGVGTTDLAGSMRSDRDLNPDLVDALNNTIEFAYDSFLGIVAQGRGMAVDAVDPVAQGRVWSAADALDKGLVDKLGSLQEAIESAAALAGVEDYTVQYVALPLSPRDMVLKQLANRLGSFDLLRGSAAAITASRWMQPMENAAVELNALQDPRHIYLRCASCSGVR
jgi:protease-4